MSLTAATAIAGTPAFLSPEAGEGIKLDSRADIYALGCVGYWLLTGDLVFDRETSMQTVIAHIQEPPPPFAQRTEMNIPERFGNIIMACLEKDPGLRPQTVRELAQMLETCGWEKGWNRERANTWWHAHNPAPTVDTENRPPSD